MKFSSTLTVAVGLLGLWLSSSPGTAQPMPSFDACGQTETFSQVNISSNPGSVSNVSRTRGNFDVSYNNQLSLPVAGPDGTDGYILLQIYQDNSKILLVPGATARFSFGFLVRLHGRASCTASFKYQQVGFSRLMLYQRNGDLVVPLWASGADTGPSQWRTIHAKLPGNMFSAAEYFFEATMGYPTHTALPYVALDDAHYPQECCGHHNCSVLEFPCDASGGDCTDTNQTCDGVSDCQNGQDEIGCEFAQNRPRPETCPHHGSCNLTDVPESFLKTAHVSRGPHWMFGNEDGGYGATGRVYNATYYRKTGWLAVRWPSGVILQYPLSSSRQTLCLRWGPDERVCGGPQSSGDTGSGVGSGDGNGSGSNGGGDKNGLCREAAHFDNLPSASVFNHLQSDKDNFNWDLTNPGMAAPGEPLLDVSGTGGYLIARSDVGGGVKRRLGERASFFTPEFAGPSGACTFILHYYIAGFNRLNVWLLQDMRRNGSVVFSAVVGTSGKWVKRAVTISSKHRNLRVELEVVLGSGGGFVAVDALVFPYACCGLSVCNDGYGGDSVDTYSCLDNVTVSSTGRRVSVARNETCVNASAVCNTFQQQCPYGTDRTGCYGQGGAQAPYGVCGLSIDYAQCSHAQHVQLLRSRLPVRVVRGNNWMYEHEDGGSGMVGTIESLDNYNTTGFVAVRWPHGSGGVYRFGSFGRYDLCIHPVSSIPQHCSDFGSSSPPTSPPTSSPTSQPPQCQSQVTYDQWQRDLADWKRLFTSWRQDTSASFCSKLGQQTGATDRPSPTASSYFMPSGGAGPGTMAPGMTGGQQGGSPPPTMP